MLGFLITIIIGGALIGVFYGLGKNKWAKTEYYWEGSFSLVAAVIITVVGAALLRLSKMQEKWRVKIARTLETGPIDASGRWSFLYKWSAFKKWCEKYAMFMVPFITVLREGIEAIVFIAGVSFSAPATAVPLPVVCGLAAGIFVGWLLYK